MEIINVRSDNPLSIQKMKKHFSDPNNTIIAAIIADWCGACQQFKPVWVETTNKYITDHPPSNKSKKLILATIQDSTIHEFDIRDIKGFPTIRVIKNNGILHEKLGGMSDEHLTRHIDAVAKTCVHVGKSKSSSKKNAKKARKSSKGKKNPKRKTSKRGKKGKKDKKGKKGKKGSKTASKTKTKRKRKQ